MCRTCKAENPKWSKGVRVPVKDLPLFFASQPSWNFEQKIYGHNVVVSTAIYCSYCPLFSSFLLSRFLS